jgi:hypothetical protein
MHQNANLNMREHAIALHPDFSLKHAFLSCLHVHLYGSPGSKDMLDCTFSFATMHFGSLQVNCNPTAHHPDPYLYECPEWARFVCRSYRAWGNSTRELACIFRCAPCTVLAQ